MPSPVEDWAEARRVIEARVEAYESDEQPMHHSEAEGLYESLRLLQSVCVHPQSDHVHLIPNDRSKPTLTQCGFCEAWLGQAHEGEA